MKNAVTKLDGPMEVRLSQFLFKYRITPQTTTGVSPAQLLMGRRLRTHLDLLHPDTAMRMNEKQEKSIPGRAPRQFKVGEKLYAKNFHGPKWITGRIVKVTGPVSYQIETDEGLVLRRHVDQLRRQYADETNDQTPNYRHAPMMSGLGKMGSPVISNTCDPRPSYTPD